MVGLVLAPGVGFEPTRPEGPQADCRAYSRHGPAPVADCPVPGSGIPALKPLRSKGLFSPLGKKENPTPIANPKPGVENQTFRLKHNLEPKLGKIGS